MNKNAFRDVLAPSVLLVVLLSLFAACSNPVLESGLPDSGMNESGAVTVRVAESGTDRTVTPGEWWESVENFELMLSGDQALGPLLFPEEEILLESLPLGLYTFTVSALDAEGRTIAAGSTSDFEVSEEPDLSAAVEMIPVMGGTGSFSVSIDWASAGLDSGYITHVIAELTPVGGTPKSAVVTISDQGITYETELPSGSYTFSCDLFAEGELVSTAVGEYRIFDELETEFNLELGSDDFEAVPMAPGESDAGQIGLSVNLSWRDTGDNETGYRIYRAAAGGEFSLIADAIPANATSWNDRSIEPGSNYLYRIVAVNEFGESAAAEIAIETEPAISVPEGTVQVSDPITIGEDAVRIPVSDLLDGFINNFNSSGLQIVDVEITGDTRASASISGDYVIIDTSEIPYEAEGTILQLDYQVNIRGEAFAGDFAVTGSSDLLLESPEVEEISEDDLQPPVNAFIYADRAELELKMQTYEPPGPEDIFESWSRILGADSFSDGSDAESSVSSRNDNADMATWWKLKDDGDGEYIEYSKNSVYAGFVCPDGQESDYYTLEATVSSKDDDDDVIGLVVGYVREGSSNYILEAARSHGALSGGTSLEPALGWGLVLRRISESGDELGEVLWSRQVDVGGISPNGWKGSASRIRVERRGDDITVSVTDWDKLDTYVEESSIRVDLSDYSELRRFRGEQKYGYFVASQERSSFRDIVIEGGAIADKLFFVDPDTGESEVWWYDTVSARWLPLTGVEIQQTLGYPIEVTNPDTGETFLVERKGFRRGSWRDWWERWLSWDNWDRGGRRRDRSDN